MRYWLVMPAAGSGRRFGEPLPKQYAPLRARTVIEWSLAPFLEDERCLGSVVAIAANDLHWQSVAARLARFTAAQPPKLLVTTGGAERCASVRKGLTRLEPHAAADDWILVHDAARPCVRREDLDRLLDLGQRHRVGGLLAVPATDTLKRAAGDEISQTVERAGLWRAMTPQMFRLRPLCEALDRAFAAGRSPTDEAQALEWLGARPLLVAGSSTNIKITSPEDLVIAEALLGAASDVDRTGGRGA